jgi:hypothetical protein
VKDTGRPIDQVADDEASGYKCVGDQSPMASPPERLGAHDCHVLARFGPGLEMDQGSPEVVRVHVRGVGREGGRPPGAWWSTPRWSWAPTTQSVPPPLIAEPKQRQIGFEPLARQMRLPTTAWIAAYVDDRPDASGSDQVRKVAGGAGSVADGQQKGARQGMRAR